VRNDKGLGLITSRSLSRTSWKQKISVILAKGRRPADSKPAGIQWPPRKDLDSSLHRNGAQKRPAERQSESSES
jgi:hypothetical protein